MRTLLALAVCAAVSVPAAPAWSCTPPVAFPNAPLHYASFAEDMVGQATFVDVVEVADEAPFAAPHLWRKWVASRKTPERALRVHPDMIRAIELQLPRHAKEKVGAHYRLQVVRRLKGASPPFINLDGAPSRAQAQGPEPATQPPLSHVMRDGHPAPNTFLIRHELSVENLVYENSCSRGPISFRRGSQYLVFRGEDGHLLGGVLFKGVKEKAWGYSVAELAPGGPAEWLAAVERAAGAVALSAGSR